MEEFGTKWGHDSEVRTETEVKVEPKRTTLIQAELETEEEGFLDLIIKKCGRYWAS